MDLKHIKNWFFDIDDTLIDTAGVNEVAAQGIKMVFGDRFDLNTGEKVKNEFVKIFDLMLVGYRVKDERDWEGKEDVKAEFEELTKKIEKLQAPVKEKWGSIKKWSREVFIKIAAEKLGLEVSPDLIQDAANAYWLTLTEKTLIFPGAKKLINQLQAKRLGVFLITSSDGRLVMREDGYFEYDPKISEALKRQRIELLRERGIHFDVLTIGDPEDKPHLDFFEKGIHDAETYMSKPVKPEESVMIGDSFGGDLQTPLEKLKYAYVILFEKMRSDIEEEGRVIKTCDLGLIASRI